MDKLASYLPPFKGLLPYWMLITASAAIYSAGQNHFILWQSKEIYSLKSHEMTPLAGRLFAAWSTVAAIIRITAAYNLNDSTLYNLAIATYALAGWHFTSELLIFRTIKINRASIGPLMVASSSIVWMLSQKDYYVK